MSSIKKPLNEEIRDLLFRADIGIYEHQVYKKMPGKRAFYREDPANTNTMTKKHAHVYSKPKGQGEELYSVNVDGTGHDGSSGREIPSSHADFFRDTLSYNIAPTNILESLNLDDLDTDVYELFVFYD